MFDFSADPTITPLAHRQAAEPRTSSHANVVAAVKDVGRLVE
jgi:hypothetical protein